MRASASLSASNGQTYQYRVTYNNGVITVWRNGVQVLSWTDTTPLTSGSFVAWRTNQSNVSFDNLRVTGSPSSYNTLVYLHGDHLGSVGVVTSSSGVRQDTTRFLPFGGYRGSDPAFLTESGFTGHKMNNRASNDLGLVFMGARFYVPSIGRFASADTLVPDPTNPQQYNRYSYSLNNPVRYTDPTGHSCYNPSLGSPCVLSDGAGNSNFKPPPFSPPRVTRLWINPKDVTAIQLYGNTNFSFNLDGTGPSYAYSQGFHGGLDLLAAPGTEVTAGIHGIIAWVSDWTAYRPRYIVIKIAPDTYVVIGHLSAANPLNLKAGDRVNPSTIVGTVGDVVGDGDHVHVEFWTGKGPTASTNRHIEIPYQFLSPKVKQQFLALMQNMNELDSRITFHQRSDGQWASREDQPRLKYNGPNLNVGQPGYDNPWD